MNNNEYLNEEKYQKTNKKVNKAGLVLLIIGIIILVIALILIISGFISFGTSGSMSSFISFAIGGFMLVFGVAISGAGGNLLLMSHRREINAYVAQQGMPIAKESIEQITPTISKSVGTIAKEIKNGLKDDNQK